MGVERAFACDGLPFTCPAGLFADHMWAMKRPSEGLFGVVSRALASVVAYGLYGVPCSPTDFAGTRDAPPGASEFRGLSSEKFGHEGRVGLPERRGGAFRRGGTRCAFRRNPLPPSMAVFPSEHVCSRPGRGHAMPLRRQARDVVKIARFVRAFAENRANRSDFHETCLKLPLLSGRGGTGVHAPARCGWRVLPSGACGRKK